MPQLLTQPDNGGTASWLVNPLPDAPGAQPYRSTGQKLLDYALHDSIPAKAVQSAWSGLTAPGDAYTKGMTLDEAKDRAWDTAGLATLGAGVVPGEANELRAGIKLADLDPNKTWTSGYSYGKIARTPLEDMTSTYGTPLEARPPQLLVNPESMQGSLIKGVPGDRTIRGSTLTSVNGKLLENPTLLEGGPRFGQERGGWASNESIAKGYVDDMNKTVEAAKGKPVNMMYVAQGERSGDFSRMTSDTIRELMKHGGVSAGDLDAFNTAVRAEQPHFGDIRNLTDEYLSGPGADRKRMAEIMAGTQWQDRGFPDVPSIRRAITEPDLRDLVGAGHAGYNIMRIGPEGMHLQPSDHMTYSHEMMNPGGGYVGSLEQSLPYSVAFPDWWQSKGQFLKGSGVDRTFGMQRPSQEANQQWLDGVMQYLQRQKEGGSR